MKQWTFRGIMRIQRTLKNLLKSIAFPLYDDKNKAIIENYTNARHLLSAQRIVNFSLYL